MLKLPTGVKRLSVNELSVMVSEDTDQIDAENVETRIWRPSLPVLHIAAAVAVAIDIADRHHQHPVDFSALILDRFIIEWVIAASQEYAGLIEKSAHLKAHAGQLIRLRRI
jgi:hypothetical protein